MNDKAALIGPAVRLVPWLRAWRAGGVSLDDVVTAITGGGLSGVDQHVVDTAAPEVPQSLMNGLAVLSAVPADDIRLVLPVPGDVRGLPRAGRFTELALASGEAVRAGRVGLVPQWRHHTSGSGDSWSTLTWWRCELPDELPPVEVVPVGEADLALSEALRECTRRLTALDVAAWNGGGGELAGLRDFAERQLPTGFDSRARLLYARSLFLDHALEVARRDGMGGAVTAAEAQARSEALRPLAAACRQAIGAACHARIGW
ncbi:hypothetical protein LX16_1947 [Stackebrandtia albiflava]|uniref:Uncharacterized protein n=1 Tax=Stackebrandtia albiflava TaxID=406432 RepID=A0A562VEB7_9ACTN|nr:hypothetical protein [Stackebrandtia albiflava]TWJ16220.1 hypothetical protein LX16_1947 [Stackebrandtia albiflava]